MYGTMWHGYTGGFPLLGMAFGLFLLVLFGLAVAALIIWLVKRPHARRTTSAAVSAPQTALEVLKERYARGELTREEFLSMRDDLS